MLLGSMATLESITTREGGTEITGTEDSGATRPIGSKSGGMGSG
jgi:hypothetical protein